MKPFGQYRAMAGDIVDFIDTGEGPHGVRCRGKVLSVDETDPWSILVADCLSLEDGLPMRGKRFAFGSDIWRAKRGDSEWGAP